MYMSHVKLNLYRIVMLMLLAGGLSVASGRTNNPLIPDNLADPEIAQFGDSFYIYSTSDVGDLQSDLAYSGHPLAAGGRKHRPRPIPPGAHSPRPAGDLGSEAVF